MKNIPKFETELKETEFWSNNDSTEYIDWKLAEPVSFPDLEPTTRSISLRLPEIMLNRLKQEANKIDVPYQALLKILINEGLERRQNAVR